MLTAKILNPEASLNQFVELDSMEFLPGEQKAIALQLFDTDKKLRYIPPSTAIVTLTFNKTDGSTLNKTTSFIDVLDRSLLSVTLQESETADLMSGNVLISVDVLGDATNIRKGLLQNALSRVDVTA